MPTITIHLEVPEGTTVRVSGAPDESVGPAAGTIPAQTAPNNAERYWRRYLSDNGRELYRAAAAVERDAGPGFTLGDIAERMGREYTSAQSIHRTSGRSARKWKDDSGAQAPIRLVDIDYEWDDTAGGRRTTYRLPDGIAEQISGF